LKALALYSAARDGRPCGVSGDLGARDRGWATTTVTTTVSTTVTTTVSTTVTTTVTTTTQRR
jgi:hypothetical protein